MSAHKHNYEVPTGKINDHMPTGSLSSGGNLVRGPSSNIHSHPASGYNGADIDAQNLISKAQVTEVLRGLNLREGLFNEDDMKQLEGGYSVSDTDEEGISAMNDILSAHSLYQRGFGADGQNVAGSPPAGPPKTLYDPGFNGAILGEIATQKHKFTKKIQGLEKNID